MLPVALKVTLSPSVTVWIGPVEIEIRLLFSPLGYGYTFTVSLAVPPNPSFTVTSKVRGSKFE